MSESWERLQGALTYIDHGWRVLPVAHIIDGACSCKRANCAAPGKHPVLSKWPEAASVDGAQVQRWWTSRKSPNVGIATGQGSGLVVLDIDPRHGGNEALAALIAEHGPLPPTPVCRTGGGGEHYYFAAPAEFGWAAGPWAGHPGGWRNGCSSAQHPRQRNALRLVSRTGGRGSGPDPAVTIGPRRPNSQEGSTWQGASRRGRPERLACQQGGAPSRRRLRRRRDRGGAQACQSLPL